MELPGGMFEYGGILEESQKFAYWSFLRDRREFSVLAVEKMKTCSTGEEREKLKQASSTSATSPSAAA
ncbi:unnamed protein product, partial [Amoebophrya sp. A25]|eukprot:GSA25T00007360001.1